MLCVRNVIMVLKWDDVHSKPSTVWSVTAQKKKNTLLVNKTIFVYE